MSKFSKDMSKFSEKMDYDFLKTFICPAIIANKIPKQAKRP